MITITVRETFLTKIQVTVCENPTPGSWGDYQLMLHDLRNLDETYQRTQYEQMMFNYNFLKDKELDYGPLWCVYCGKEELVIYHWKDKHHFYDMATVDHFIPLSEAPHLARVRTNLKVACRTCNNTKGSTRWKEKYPYD